MTDKDEDLLADLLLRWEELREQGQDVSALELCQGCPQLADELARRINALMVTSWLDKPVDVPAADPNSFNFENHEPRTLIGRYRLDDLIAEGGFAQVWRAYDLELHRSVAVKVLKPSRMDSADAFMAEARRVARLKHPGIVPVHDVGREDGICFIVSEFVEGGNLGDHLARRPLEPRQATRWAIDIAEALEYAHSNGVVHRDIKPANILIDHHGRALLADFGIAQSANKTGKFAPSISTLRFMSPEQLDGKEADARSDIYSLGVVLHELLTGKLPYSSSEPNVLRREIVTGAKVGPENMPSELRRICLKALERDPAARYPTALQMAADLGRHLATVVASPWLWVVLFSTVICFGLAVVVWLMNQPPSDPQSTETQLPPASASPIVQTKANVRKPGQIIKNSVGMEFAWIPPGTFVMGSAKTEAGAAFDELQHNVVLTKGFYFGVHEVTREQFAFFIQESKYDTSDWRAEWLPQANNYPVTCVNWDDALAFCQWLSRKEKVTYRLPTEAEWEYACRAGSKTAYHFGPEITKQDAHFDRNNDCSSGSLVGSYAPNAWGLHDMHGNVFEWCADWYGAYPEADVTDPVGPIAGDKRVCRSGCYWKDRSEIRAASRHHRESSLRGYDNGFRVVRVTPADEPLFEEAMSLGKQLHDQNLFDHAVESYSQAIALDPNKAEAFDQRGTCRFKANKFKQCVPDFNKAIELNPKNAEFFQHRALAYFSLRVFEPSIADMEQAIKLNPPNRVQFEESLATIYSNRAAERATAKKFVEAAEDMTLAIKLFPQGNNFHHQRGSCYFNNKEYEKAALDFTEAINMEPTKGAHYLHRGYCLQAMGKNEEAAADFEKAKSLSDSP